MYKYKNLKKRIFKTSFNSGYLVFKNCFEGGCAYSLCAKQEMIMNTWSCQFQKSKRGYKETELIFRHGLFVHYNTVVLLLMLLNWPYRRLYDSNVATICWNLLTVEVFMIIPAIVLSLCSFLFQLYTIQISQYRSVCFLLYPKNGIHTC